MLKDEAALLGDDGAPAPADQLGLVHSVVTLQAKLRNGTFSSYRADLAGLVDPSRRGPPSVGTPSLAVFGWDDVFVPLSTGEDLHSRRAAGAKVSSRDAVVSDFLREHVHYARLKDLAHAASLTHPRETVDFSIDPADFVARHALLSKGLAVPGFGAVLRAVVNGGLFFRAADCRRTGNYWWPGLNAGREWVPGEGWDDGGVGCAMSSVISGSPLPMFRSPLRGEGRRRPRGDVHGPRQVPGATSVAASATCPPPPADFGHYLIPDRIPTGSAFSRSAAGRRLYIAQRMASEVRSHALP